MKNRLAGKTTLGLKDATCLSSLLVKLGRIRNRAPRNCQREGERRERNTDGPSDSWPPFQGVRTYIQRRSRAEASPSSRPCAPRSHFPREKNRSLTFDGSRLGYSGQRVTLFFHGSSLGSLSLSLFPVAINRQPTLSYTAEQTEEQRHQR